ncbi:MAG TPA: ABC transporter permease [Actinomycetota bacterium]|nr:ABC transporter permease [Actinomycetota bacterium]
MRALAKLTWVELKLFTREPFAVIFTFAFPLVVLVVLNGVFGKHPDPDFGGARPTDYYLAGYIGVVIGAIGLVALPVHVAAYRERGILRRFRASSVPGWSVLGAQVIVGFLMATVGSIILVVVGTLAYDTALPASVGGTVAAFVVGTLTFLAIGFLLGSLTRNARAAQAVGMILFFPMWLLSGAGPPPRVMGEGMRRISDGLPLTYAVRALQDPWLGSPTNAMHLLILAVALLVAGTLSIRMFRIA